MTDFLTRLAERAVGAAPAVKPKLPRRFAALPPPADEELAWWSEELRRAAEEARARDAGVGPAPPARPRGVPRLPPRRPR